ncbi:sensor histidine kinase DpiB [Clostridium homopropionicum DSM 5847]|uniref:histidine kinase n=1 Tax=Clostridium homopropionicum DSM 5847 TaxID=1121318 RepID=A0A0L6Z8I1_9CLOT|nr:ATP-binding protein [Clostridium homopropionicum]KOA19264.1 sensor histidine kinase DpiB [Clostridium homopropionicum DSM 5847]SFG19146.1 Histidine kinase-, DNA gyrase B-, and HSP90-like ATPase [Clostridium homopropionicum]
MLLKFCDIFNTLCQSILFVWSCNNVANKDDKLSKTKTLILITFIFTGIVILTYSDIYISDIPFGNFLIFLLILLSSLFLYRRSILDALIGIGLGYSLVAFLAYFLVTFHQNVLIYLKLNVSTEVQMFLFIYIPIWISYYFVYKSRKYIFDVARYLKNLKHNLFFVLILDYALIFLDTLRMEWTTHDMGLVFKSVLYFIAFITFVMAVIYFAKINDKSKEVEMLNAALNEKITELRKIKHDYGSEISGLYGLYQLGKMDRVGEMLKSIVQRNQALNTAVSVSICENPIVASVLHSATSKGVNVIVDDNGNYDELSITDNELLKLISNIIKNSIDVLSEVKNPIIKYKSYNSYNGITITIMNNGPEIPKDIRNKIFDSGFTTKKNDNSDRGYGLSIVKDIIAKCNGEISVESDDNWTQFKLEIPYMKF